MLVDEEARLVFAHPGLAWCFRARDRRWRVAALATHLPGELAAAVRRVIAGTTM